MDPEAGRSRRRVSAAAKKTKKKGPSPYSVPKTKGLGDVLQETTRQIASYNLYIFVLAMVGLVLQIVVVEITHRNSDSPSDFVNILKLIVTLTTLLAVGLLAAMLRKRYEWEKSTNSLLHGDNVWSSGYATWFAISAVMLLIHSPPTVQFEIPSYALSIDDARHGWHKIHYSSDEIICALMFVRVLWMFRVIFDWTGLSMESSRALCMLYEERVSMSLFIRYLLRIYPIATVAIETALAIVIQTYLIMLFERRADPAFDSLATSAWLVIITYSTVGYGDVTPHSVLGRFVVMIICVMALLSLALLIYGVLSKFQLTPKQYKVVHLLQHSQMQHRLKSEASTVISRAWRAYQKTQGTSTKITESSELCFAIRRFRTLRKNLSVPIDQGTQLLFKEMLSLQDSTKTSFSTLDEKVSKMEKTVSAMEERLDVKLKEISENMKTTLKMLKGLQ